MVDRDVLCFTVRRIRKQRLYGKKYKQYYHSGYKPWPLELHEEIDAHRERQDHQYHTRQDGMDGILNAEARHELKKRVHGDRSGYYARDSAYISKD